MSAFDRGQWVQDRVAFHRGQNPNASVMVVCTCSKHRIEGPHKTLQDNCGNCFGQKFAVYIIPYDAGRTVFVLEGDGGFINWAFSGRSDRPGNGKTDIF